MCQLSPGMCCAARSDYPANCAFVSKIASGNEGQVDGNFAEGHRLGKSRRRGIGEEGAIHNFLDRNLWLDCRLGFPCCVHRDTQQNRHVLPESTVRYISLLYCFVLTRDIAGSIGCARVCLRCNVFFFLSSCIASAKPGPGNNPRQAFIFYLRLFAYGRRLSGILPPVLLAILFALLPIILCGMF